MTGKRKQKKWTHLSQMQVAPEILCEKYRKHIYRVEYDTYYTEYHSAYSIGNLTLCLYDPQHFFLYVTSLHTNVDSGHAYTTSLETVGKGVEYLDSLADWSRFNTFTEEEKKRLFLLVDRAFTDYFGAAFYFFEKEVMKAVGKYVQAVEAMNRC